MTIISVKAQFLVEEFYFLVTVAHDQTEQMSRLFFLEGWW